MSNTLTITGRLGDDIELRFTPQGKAVANGRIADTPRKFDQQANEWTDAGETLWLSFSVWDRKAEALAEAAHKGDLVTVTGTLVARSWDAPEGKRTVTEIKASEVAVVPRLTAKPAGQSYGQQQSAPVPQGDLWATSPGSGQQTAAWGNQPTEPPF